MSYITINKAHFKHNLNVIRTHLDSINKNKKIEIAAVLKDNAYGHGLDIMSDLARECGIESVFVKNYYEAICVADKFKNVTFFYGILPSDFDKTKTNIYQSIHSIDDFSVMDKYCDLFNVGVELKVNVGMNRNGIQKSEIEKCINEILKRKMRLVGVFSHNGFGDSDECNFKIQCDNFLEIKEEVLYLSKKMGFNTPRFHSLNSSCTLRSKNSDDDLVRIGIALYGYLTNDIFIESAKDLKPILKLYANKISTKELHKGDRVGYDGLTKINKISKVSTYDIGYGDGFYRINGSKEVKMPNGEQILPKTSMDCFSCFCTDDEICVMDNADYIAKIFDTIPYEVLTRLSPFIKRIVI